MPEKGKKEVTLMRYQVTLATLLVATLFVSLAPGWGQTTTPAEPAAVVILDDAPVTDAPAAATPATTDQPAAEPVLGPPAKDYTDVVPPQEHEYTGEKTPYYQTRDGHNEASRRVLSGKFPGTIEADTVKCRRLVWGGKEFLVDPKGKVIASRKIGKAAHTSKSTAGPAGPNLFTKVIDGLKKDIADLVKQFKAKDAVDKKQDKDIAGIASGLNDIQRDIHGAKDSKTPGMATRLEIAERDIETLGARPAGNNLLAWLALGIAFLSLLWAIVASGKARDAADKAYHHARHHAHREEPPDAGDPADPDPEPVFASPPPTP